MKKVILLFVIFYSFSNVYGLKLKSPYNSFQASIKLSVAHDINQITIKTNNIIVKIDKQLSQGDYTFILKKEFNKFFYKIFRVNEISPEKWSKATVSHSYIEDSIKVLNVVFKPINTMSINSSWGKIKYLFAN